jgi:hypothetical protein
MLGSGYETLSAKSIYLSLYLQEYLPGKGIVFP